MQIKDRRVFTALFKRNGAVDRFHNPGYKRSFVVIQEAGKSFFITRRAAVELIKFILPRYRVYSDEKELIDAVYSQLNISRQRADKFDERLISDPNIRNLFLQENPILSEQAHTELENINKLPEMEKATAAESWVAKFHQQEISKPPGQPQIPEKQAIQSPPAQAQFEERFGSTIPPLQEKVQAPGFIKDLLSRTQIFIKKFISRHLSPTQIASLFTGVLGAVTGFASGPSFGVSRGVGTAVGGGVGLVTPTLIKTFFENGGGEMVLNAGRGGLNTTEGLLTNLSRLDNFTGKFSVFSRTGLILIIALILGLTFFISGGGGSPQNLEAGPITIANLSSCQFYRGDRTPPGATYQSPLLLGYFQEAERLSGVPAVLLASIARVESPTATSKTDSDIPALGVDRCPISPTGALGIMQIQPIGTTGSIPAAIDQGASYLGKTASELTQSDYCDPKTSIILSAGFILKKLQLRDGIGDGKTWNLAWINDKTMIDQIANDYYGCLNYGDPTRDCTGPFNYGDDLWNSLQGCKSSALAQVSCPVTSGVTKTPSFQGNPTTGHCSPTYGSCPANSRRAKSIDIDTKGQEIRLPTIAGQSVKWTYLTSFLLNKPGDCESNTSNCGIALVFQASNGADNWTLHLLHVDVFSLQIQLGQTKDSGTLVGKTIPSSFLHINIGKNITNPGNPPVGSIDFDPGWFAPDADIKMCL